MYLDHQKEYHTGTILVMLVKLTTVEIDSIEGKKFSIASENWLSFSFWLLVLSPEIKHAIFDWRHRSHIIKPYHCLILHDLNFTPPPHTHIHMFFSVCRCLCTHMRSRKMCVYVLYMFDIQLCICLCLHKETWSHNLNVRFLTMLGFESRHVWFDKIVTSWSYRSGGGRQISMYDKESARKQYHALWMKLCRRSFKVYTSSQSKSISVKDLRVLFMLKLIFTSDVGLSGGSFN